uniref:Chondroitin sulfate proteoglycan 4 n=1 Tax=Geotrypetes seraphini TaxID=260995 RepID=A0A6P8P3F2_GEOSA|nr:chondroitin sulfate proteoglycan 4 [Geotrypetes seraphini]
MMKPASVVPGVLLLLPLLVHAGPNSGASFFGQSYVKVPLEDTPSKIKLHVQFFTGQRTGLLFLAAGQSNYLLMELRSGTLQIRLQLGFGEVLLSSPAGLKLNNLISHDAELLIAEGKMTLILDHIFNTSAWIPGHKQDMNIHYGLYVGGKDNLDLPYLSRSSMFFRGCIHVAIFNDIDCLNWLSSRTFHEVQKGCSLEFSAGPDDSFSFMGPRSFTAFPGWSAREEGTIDFVITSDIKRGPLLYHSGFQNDFVYLEIMDSHLRGAVSEGNGIVTLQNNIYVSDNQPHHVKMFINRNQFEISVDSHLAKIDKPSGNNYLDLQGNLFIGGIDENTFERLRENQLAGIIQNGMTQGSFVGCMKDLKINLDKKSLQDAVVTKDIDTDCKKRDTNINYKAIYEEYEELTTPTSDILPGYWEPSMEPCHTSSNLSSAFMNFTRLLNFSPLIVKEGGTTFMEWKHAQPTIDLNSVGIRQSQVLFSVVYDASHGQLELDIPGAKTRKKFTLLDIVNRKVRFVHDGSERFKDQLVLEVTVNTKVPVPECLHKGQSYLLPIIVTPVNDAPHVIFPQGDVMTILENTRKILSSDVIHIIDEDTPCDNLKIVILGGKKTDENYVEYSYEAEQAIDEFSCKDLEADNVIYVHQKGPISQLLFQVSDGTSRSPIVTLRIIAIEPDIQVGNNTGLIISQGDIATISSTNLSIETNAVKQKLNIIYRITEPLSFGEVRKEINTREWKTVKTFKQQDIDQGHVQYFSTDTQHRKEDVTEKLRFEVQVGQKFLRNNTFFIKIKRATIKMLKMIPLELKNTLQHRITIHQLEAAVEHIDPGATSLYYMILQAPRKGNLLLLGQRLTEGFGFNQEDLLKGYLSYRATIRNANETEDYFQFRVQTADQQQHSPTYTYLIKIGADPDAPVLTNVILSVLEGDKAFITADYLFVKSLNSMNYLYEVIEGPQHGKLLQRTSSRWSLKDESITRFTNEDILQHRLFYQHDDSETTEDDIPFVASKQEEGSADTLLPDQEAEEVRGVFRVSIQPKNDHPPVQVVDKVFKVVRNGQRLLTTKDIAFFDPDSGTFDLQLTFVRRGIPFGSIVFVDDTAHQVYRFTQEDLRLKKILFIHSGADHGHFQLQVSDGLYHLGAILEVQASDPYLQIMNNTGLVVHQGSQEVLDASVLSLETNIDIRNDDDIIYQIITPPKWGMILKDGWQVSSFTQKDLLGGELLYHHNGSMEAKDYFEISVEAHQVIVEDTIEISIILDDQYDPPQLVHNEKIYVFQEEEAQIKKEHLMVSDEDSFPHEIVYTIKRPPNFGHILMVSHMSSFTKNSSLENVLSFTQDDINEGNVLYSSSRSDQASDHFLLDVTNGVMTLEDILVELEILPNYIPLEIHNITVEEGGAVVLSSDILSVSNAYFTTFNLEFMVLEQPRNGSIRNAARHEDNALHVFTWDEVEQQLIIYQHDDSESSFDSFTVIANASEIGKWSQPIAVSVAIVLENDESPLLTVNTGLQLWEDTAAEITSAVLSSDDLDSPPEEVLYSIQPPVNGRVLLKSYPVNKEVLQFTQAQVNQGLVMFLHAGPLDGGFLFDVSDGENVSPGHFFTVIANRLVITVETKQDLTVCPGTLQPITSQHLKAVTNNNVTASQDLVYVINEPPHFGKLVNAEWTGSKAGRLGNFSQSQVDAGVIFYLHEMPQDPFWISHDAIHFRVVSSPAVTELLTLPVSISFEEACPQLSTHLWKNKGLTVSEGQNASIDNSVLDASNLMAGVPESNRTSYDVMFLLNQLPTYGRLSIANELIDEKHPYFLQSDLNEGDLAYVHRGSAVQPDSFRFSAWLWPRSQAITMPPQEVGTHVISEQFNITVRDINERPPQLMTRTPMLQAAPGSTITLTPDHLNVVDPDSTPEEIEYTIINKPTSGFLAHHHERTVPITRFTQRDINEGSLMFIVSENNATDSILLSVSDNHHPAIFTSLVVYVTPVFLTVISKMPLQVPQVENQASLSSNHLLAVSEKGQQEVLYKVTKAPKFGQLRINHKAMEEFTQKQVNNEEVTFVFTDLSSSHDEFWFLAISEAANATGRVPIRVKPLIRMQEGILWPRGTTVLVNTQVLDANELANGTKSVPTFKVLEAPQECQFVKISRDNESQSLPIDVFTQNDLNEGLIGLEVLETKNGNYSFQNYSFHLELAATGVPPAASLLSFTTGTYDPSYPYNATFVKVPHKPKKGSKAHSLTSTVGPWLQETEASSNITENKNVSPRSETEVTSSASPTEGSTVLGFLEANVLSIIVPVCLILLLLVASLLLLFYLIKRNKTGKHQVQGTTLKAKNGAVDNETFRKTDPNQAISLNTMTPHESRGPQSPSTDTEPRKQADPELLQSCRTSNPTLKNNQYWV